MNMREEEQIMRAVEVIETLPHVKGCRSEFAPQLCTCDRGLALDLLINLQAYT